MKKIVFLTMGIIAMAASACAPEKPANAENVEQPWIVDRFDDIKIIRYEVPEFENQSLNDKLLIYYLAESAKCGRDILFDQNFKYNLVIRRALEKVYTSYKGDKESTEFKAMEKYLKKVWLANGIHHHYSNDKFQPEFSREWFEEQLKACKVHLPVKKEVILEAIFNPELYATRLNQAKGADVIATSAGNYYEGVTQKEVEKFYNTMIKKAGNDPCPISYGLNSKLVKKNGKIYEQTWKIGGMYSEALEQIVYWLEKAHEVAEEPTKDNIAKLIKFYKSGDLRDFDAFNVAWVKDTTSNVDFVNGFTEVYGDPLGYKASWESVVNFLDKEACRRTQLISDNAQWFEDHSPINPAYRKKEVKGVSAKVITVAMLGGDTYPTTPIGINLPNADWIRKEHGSKSVTIDNITYAYNKAAQGNGFAAEFVLRDEDRARMKEHGKLSDDLHTDLHECLGHGSGQLAPGTTGTELGVYSSALEETRADLFALYYLGDEKMVEIGLIPSLEVAKAQYSSYIMNGAMTQFSRIELGKNVEQAHMRNRKLISEWAYDLGKEENVIEWVVKDGKRYIVVNDFDKLRAIFGKQLCEIQRIKSEGDFKAGQALIEKYAVKIDPELHKEVRERYEALNIAPYSGMVNPEYELVMEGDKIVDVKVSYPANYIEQHLLYSKEYSFLPSIN